MRVEDVKLALPIAFAIDPLDGLPVVGVNLLLHVTNNCFHRHHNRDSLYLNIQLTSRMTSHSVLPVGAQCFQIVILTTRMRLLGERTSAQSLSQLRLMLARARGGGTGEKAPRSPRASHSDVRPSSRLRPPNGLSPVRSPFGVGRGENER